MKMLDLILTSQKYANVTPLDSTGCGRRPETLIEFVFPGFDLFRDSLKHSCKTSNIELWGRRGPRG